MRRRLDIPPLPYLGPDGGLYHWLPDGAMVPFGETINEYQFEGEGEDEDGQELGALPPNPLAAAQDYVARARYLAGEQDEDAGPASAVEARRAIAKLERATTELRQGIMGQY